jgi:hypothetical protein
MFYSLHIYRKVRYTLTWDGNSGVTVLYIDGKESKRGKLRGQLQAGGSLILGQEQDNVGGGFAQSQRFIGDLCNPQMWDHAFSDEGELHDQEDAKWIVIRGQLRGHNDTLFRRPSLGRLVDRPGPGCP